MSAGKWRNVVIAIHNALPPEPEEWARYVEFLRELVQSEPTATRGLTFTDGAAPTAGQRAQLNAILRAQRVGRLPGSIVSDSVLVRAAVSALSLVVPAVESFSPKNLRGALNHIGVVRREDMAALMKYVRELGDAVTGQRTLKEAPFL